MNWTNRLLWERIVSADWEGCGKTKKGLGLDFSTVKLPRSVFEISVADSDSVQCTDSCLPIAVSVHTGGTKKHDLLGHTSNSRRFRTSNSWAVRKAAHARVRDSTRPKDGSARPSIETYQDCDV
jgi:hypothetical protein